MISFPREFPCQLALVGYYFFIGGLGGIYLVRTVFLYFNFEMVRLRLNAYRQYSASNVNKRKSERMTSVLSFVLGNKQHWIHSKAAAAILWGIVVFVSFVPMVFDIVEPIARKEDGACVFKFTSVSLPILQIVLLMCLLTMAYKLKQPQFSDHFYIKAEFKLLGISATVLFIAYAIMKYGFAELNWPYLGESLSFLVIFLCLLGSIYFPIILTIIHYRSIKSLHALESAKMIDIKSQLELCLADEQARSALTTYCESQFCVENVLFL
jgi:hypothetical protein